MKKNRRKWRTPIRIPFFTISVSMILLIWACGTSNVNTQEVPLPDTHPQTGLAENEPSDAARKSFEKKNYEKIREEMRPGDVIAFSGKTFASRVVMAVTGSNVSHVGIVVPSTVWDGASGKEPVIAEVTEKGLIFSHVSDLVSGKRRDESAVLWWLRLAEKPDPEAIATVVRKHTEKSYDYQQATLLVLEPLAPVFDDAGSLLKAEIARRLSDALVPRLRVELQTELQRGPWINSVEIQRALGGQPLESLIPESKLRDAISEAIDVHLDVESLVDPYVSRLQNQADARRLFCSEFVTDVFVGIGMMRDIIPAQTTPIEVCRLEGIYDNTYVQFKGDAEETILEAIVQRER